MNWDKRTIRIFFKYLILIWISVVIGMNCTDAIAVSKSSYNVQTQRNLSNQLGTYRHIKFISPRGYIDLYAVTLTNKYHAHIYQQPAKTQAIAESIGALTQKLDFLLGINGGFYNPSFKPAGLFIEKGIVLQPFIKDPLAISCIYTDQSDKIFLEKHPENCSGAFYAMQTGPLIIDQGNISSDVKSLPKKLPNLKVFFEPQRRTILALTSDRKILVITTSKATLLEIADILKNYPTAFGVRSIQTALDLDGGISTGMYIKFNKQFFYFQEQKRVKTFVFFD